MTRNYQKKTVQPMRLATLAAVLIAMTACGGAPMQPTLTSEQAKQAAADAVHAAASISFPAGYKLTEIVFPAESCTDSSDKETGQVRVGVTYWVDGPDRAQNSSYYEKLKKWWTDNGWTIETDTWQGDQFANAHNGDGYVMSLTGTVTGTVLGRLSIGASSPCVWPNGTPEPKS
ncbi:hypothetical protein [Amycolatopsis sp. La24]|uniref:hypothetical protein n=1 Tax=Amycolatopsis sp. La24 TaxID=3028304 RepID=UPI0023AF6A11|nr:hypothetical protein [Amycolatopsis sp. La24]